VSLCPYGAEPRTGADALQLTLVPRSSFRAQLTASVRPTLRRSSMSHEKEENHAYALGFIT
jgi:hypothetical protein